MTQKEKYAREVESFDSVTGELETLFAELRRLVAATEDQTGARTDALRLLNESLYNVHIEVSDLRHALVARTDSSSEMAQLVKNEFYRSYKSGSEPNEATVAAEQELKKLEERLRPKRDFNAREGDIGGAPVPSLPIFPQPPREGGAAKTFVEADEPPRNP